MKTFLLMSFQNLYDFLYSEEQDFFLSLLTEEFKKNKNEYKSIIK